MAYAWLMAAMETSAVVIFWPWPSLFPWCLWEPSFANTIRHFLRLATVRYPSARLQLSPALDGLAATVL